MKSILGYTIVGLFIAALFAVIMALSVLLTGFTISTLWGWFVTPVFASAPTIGVLQAAGISMVVRMFTYTVPAEADSLEDDTELKKNKYVKQTIYAIIYPVVALIIGWVLHLFV